MSALVAEGGAMPERLTFVRTARGVEDHKGLGIWNEGGPEDLCITTWLAGKVATATATGRRARRSNRDRGSPA